MTIDNYYLNSLDYIYAGYIYIKDVAGKRYIKRKLKAGMTLDYIGNEHWWTVYFDYRHRRFWLTAISDMDGNVRYKIDDFMTIFDSIDVYVTKTKIG